jgi:hypothetical protein
MSRYSTDFGSAFVGLAIVSLFRFFRHFTDTVAYATILEICWLSDARTKSII